MTDQSPLDYGAAVNFDGEVAVLGACLMDNGCLANVAFLEPAHFGEPLHGEIFDAIRGMVARGRKADPITLAPFLSGRVINEHTTVPQYLARLVSSALPASLAKDYAISVLESHVEREGARRCHETAKAFLTRGTSVSLMEIVSRMEEDAGALRSLAPKMKVDQSWGDSLDGMMARIFEPRSKGAAGVPFPLPEIADVLQEDDFQAGNLYGLLGASGEGKTSLMLQCARTAIDNGNPVLLVSFDQTEGQVALQMVSQETGISVSQARRHKPGERETIRDAETKLMVAARDKLMALPMGVKKVANVKIGVISSMVKRWADSERKRHQIMGVEMPTPLFILDHNRKVVPEDAKAHEGRIAGAVNGAGKALAEEIGGAVLYVNQRNSKGLSRYVPRPIAEDLFGGETAKEDYDAILTIYRPERWRDEQLSIAKDEKEAEQIRKRFMLRRSFSDEPRDPEGMAEIGAVKVRYGNSNVREFVKFEGRFTRYVSERRAAPELF